MGGCCVVPGQYVGEQTGFGFGMLDLTAGDHSSLKTVFWAARCPAERCGTHRDTGNCGVAVSGLWAHGRSPGQASLALPSS